MHDPSSDNWVIPELAADYPTIHDVYRIDTIEAFGLEPHAVYKLEIFKTMYGEHDQMENVEMGERYDISFSLKIDFSEFDDDSIADNLNKIYKDILPRDID